MKYKEPWKNKQTKFVVVNDSDFVRSVYVCASVCLCTCALVGVKRKSFFLVFYLDFCSPGSKFGGEFLFETLWKAPKKL